MTKEKTAGVYLLAVFAGFAAALAIFHTLQMLGLFPISGPFGMFKFFTFSLAGAIIYGVLAAIYIWLVKAILDLDPGAWWFLMIISLLYLIFDVIALVGGTPIEAMMPSLLTMTVILVVSALPSTQRAFGVREGPAA